MGELIPGAPPAVEAQVATNFDMGGTQDRGQIDVEPDLTWPAMGKRYTEYYQDHNRYRARGGELALGGDFLIPHL